MIKFDSVTKSFQEDFWKKPKVILDNLNFEVPEGALCGFLGANGAGKTTSIKSMLGFISIDSGNISFSPALGRELKEVFSKIGYFPEAPYFYTHMTGMEFCLYLGKLQNVPLSKLKERIKYWSERLNIDFALGKKIRGYSKGMMQRLGFVSSLLHDPKLVILDEPLSGLDPLGRKEFKDILIELNNSGVTIFFSSHIVSDVEEICDNLVVIKNGVLSYSGSTQNLLNQKTAKDYRVSFFCPKSPEGQVNGFELLKSVDQHYIGKIKANERNSLLNYVLQNNGEINEVSLERFSLEEIIYMTTQGGN